MKVLVTGGMGFIGRKLVTALLNRDMLLGQPIERVMAADAVVPGYSRLKDPRYEECIGDITDPGQVNDWITEDTKVIFHLAAVVSGQAEEDFDLGMNVNFDGTRRLLERARSLGTCPHVVFASSVAAFGGDMPGTIEDGTAVTPQTSYGTQKAVGELLINDYSRKGFVDGRALRLPTIVVRPGKPNRAASSFASAVLREPLEGRKTVCPVVPETKVWLLSPRKVVNALLHAAELPAKAWGMNRIASLPGMTVSVAQMVDSLREVAGADVASRVSFAPDPVIEQIVYGWATNFAPERALALGFEADRSLLEVVESFIEDELGGEYVP